MFKPKVKFVKSHNQTFVFADGRFICTIEKRCGSRGKSECAVWRHREQHVFDTMWSAKRYARDLARKVIHRDAYLNGEFANG